ncbi:MAG: class II aldolase/adducin family protein [Anaerolineae bacterium]|jgi:L-fuculose-phosphate aldolase|nr:class II aldolase/adducin family protein [Anaerolineae bacterium]MBT7073941.1 class II aldolase/adducin family protein [Anaerolineae bacterium]
MKIKNNLKEIIVETGIKMLAEGLTVGTWGNFSVRDPETGLIYITPSGMAYNSLQTEDVVVLDKDANLADGKRIPSIEHPMHLALYAARADVNAVVHTHPIYSTVLGVNGMELPAISEDFAQIVGYKMSCSKYALPGTKELGQNVVKGLGKENGVLLPNHGTVVVGANMPAALTICHVVEKSAQTYILAKSIGTPNIIPDADIKAMQDYVQNEYGQKGA